MHWASLTIGCLGAGAMAEAILGGLAGSGMVRPDQLLASDANPGRLDYLQKKLGLKAAHNNVDLVKRANVIILAVKPKVMAHVLSEACSLIKGGQTVISIAAGITTSFIEQYLPEGVPVCRVMPNTPALVGAGASAVCAGSSAGEDSISMALAICSSFGRAVVVDEDLMDSVTGLSGSGPAYMYLIAEAMADAGVKMGLPRDVALTLGTQTMLGAARMVLETGEHPARLKDMVTTPGGTTIAGLFALEDGKLRSAIMKAVQAATERSRELSQVK